MQELVRKYHSGAYVYRESEEGDYAFIVRTGKIRLCCQRGNDLNTLEDLHENRLFGEQAFVDRMPRVSAAVAVAESECYAIPRREFTDQMMRLGGERMRALRNMLLFVARVPMFDARGVRVKPELPIDTLKQVAALCASDLVLSMTRTKEPLVNIVAEQLRFEAERRLPREVRIEPAPLPPVSSPLRDKLAAQKAAPPNPAVSPPLLRASTTPAAKPATPAKAPTAYSSFDMRKI